MALTRPQLKLALKYGTLHRLLALGRLIPENGERSAARVISLAAAPLRPRLRSAMARALGDARVPAQAEKTYLDNFSLWAAHVLRAYHRGLINTGIPELVRFDESESILKRVLAEGRGVIFAVPHIYGHEMTAGLMARKYPTVGLVRESKYPPHMRVKMHFYNVSGECEVIVRPRRGTISSDMRVCMRTLKQGKILMVTPDLLVKPGQGLALDFLGRIIHLRPGIISLSMFTGAPVINVFLYWKDGRATVHCSEPQTFPRKGDNEQTLVEGMQNWCGQFEDYLVRHPYAWHFWLDRHWNGIWKSGEPAS